MLFYLFILVFICITAGIFSLYHYKKAGEKLFAIFWGILLFILYACKNNNVGFANGHETELIYDIIMEEANKIVDVEKLEIENKLILSMAIRLRAEKYMKEKILSDVPNGTSIINDIYSKKNQSAWMIKAYRKYINDGVMNTLELVAMITPENIHLNSFMFEPILDMSLKHLYDLYQMVKGFSAE